MSVPAESATEDSTATTEGEMQTKMSYAEWKKERKKQEKAERKRQKKSGATTSLSGLVFLGFFLMMIPLVGALLHVHIYGWQPNKSQDGSGGKLDMKFEGDVIEIVPDTLDEFLFHEGDSTSVALLFYAPWCQHCQRFKPDWQVIGGAYRKANHAKIAQVDCTTSEADCAMYEVDSYPTLLYWRDPSRNRHPQKWEGSKDVPTLMEWVRYGLGPYCTNEQQQQCAISSHMDPPHNLQLTCPSCLRIV